MKILKQFDTAIKAEMLRSWLEDKGIKAVLLDDNSPYIGAAIKVRVAVSEGQYEEARQLLDEWITAGN